MDLGGDVRKFQIHFLLGFSRSGTSIVMTYLRGHPHIETGFEEPNHLYRLMGTIDWKTEHEDELGIEEKEITRILNESIMVFEKYFYLSLCELTHKRMAVLKHPWLNIHVKALAKIFSEAKFIILIRHPFDVIASCIDFKEVDKIAEKMFPKGLNELIDLYLRHTKTLLNAEKLWKGRFKLVKFEDFLAAPSKFLFDIFEFLDVKRDEKLIKNLLTCGTRDGISITARVLDTTQIIQPEKKFLKLKKEDQLTVERRLTGLAKRLGYRNYMDTLKKPVETEE